MRQRLPGQVGNARKTCTKFGHDGIVTAPHRATHPIYPAGIPCGSHLTGRLSTWRRMLTAAKVRLI